MNMEDDAHIRSALTSEDWDYQPRSAEEVRHSGRPRTAVRWGIAGLAAAVALGAGWWGMHTLNSPQDPSFAGASDVTLITHQPMPISMEALLAGTLVLDDGCLEVDDTLVIWPAGSQWDESRQAVTLSQDGQDFTVATGSQLPDLGGGTISLDEVSAYLDPAYLAAASSCLGSSQSVLVVN
ncbi:hypothetical protein [Nocardioides sp.]|uniref:hypothetical protein n=1 Tax=Nocardioides sp. TaxID=35761 RepID=UPI0019C37E57|nr:hypothetical protein [Nocardioides sp.]MBC7279773.1 hypothetical protein [Nocardioides sp.]